MAKPSRSPGSAISTPRKSGVSIIASHGRYLSTDPSTAPKITTVRMVAHRNKYGVVDLSDRGKSPAANATPNQKKPSAAQIAAASRLPKTDPAESRSQPIGPCDASLNSLIIWTLLRLVQIPFLTAWRRMPGPIVRRGVGLGTNGRPRSARCRLRTKERPRIEGNAPSSRPRRCCGRTGRLGASLHASDCKKGSYLTQNALCHERRNRSACIPGRGEYL